MSKSFSANSAGASSAAICCSTCPILRRAICSPSFDAFPWRRDDKALAAWQRGRTGYPIVDAGMRELWHTGVMHNRVRMVVASFLVKHLLIDWREGEQWFWDTLVDADAGSNPANWQWVAGSGADAAPYFRVFNPVLQGEKFDPDGGYVRRWVPELARLPDSADPSALERDAARTCKRGRGTRQELSAADRRSQGRSRTRARRLCEGPQRLTSSASALTRTKIRLSSWLLTKLGDDMDDDTPILEQMTDAVSSAADATTEVAKTVVKKVRKAAKEGREESDAEEGRRRPPRRPPRNRQ